MTEKCSRNKIWSGGGSPIGATGASWDIGNPCQRNATQRRNDGKSFCTRCAKTEKNGLFTELHTWETIKRGTNK